MSALRLSILSVAYVASSLVGQARSVRAQETLVFEGREWQVNGPARVGEVLGRPALRVGNGYVLPVGVEFENGTVAFEMATTGVRSFVGLSFRIGSEESYERVYLRPHNSGRFDALQYTPMYHRLAAWQLYPEYNASVELPSNSWIPIRIEVHGSAMTLFVGEGNEPVLHVERLRGPRGGKLLALESTVPDVPADLLPIAFSRIRIEPSEEPTPFAPAEDPPPGFVTEWALSPAIPLSLTPIRELPGLPKESEWTTVPADELGRVNIAESRALPGRGERGTVLARVTIEADRARTVSFGFGYSDEVSVFLNGTLLFSGNATYLSRSGRYLGIMTSDKDRLYLPLRAGSNELVLVVTEAFGGWGVTGRFYETAGLTIRAR